MFYSSSADDNTTPLSTSAVADVTSFPDCWRTARAASAAFNFESFFDPAATG